MKQYLISRSLSNEQAHYVTRLLDHPCFRWEQITLRAVRLARGEMRLSLECPWEYRNTFLVDDSNTNRKRIELQLDIFEEYCRAHNAAYGNESARPQPYGTFRGPIELRQIAGYYDEEIQDLFGQIVAHGTKTKIRTSDQRLQVGFSGYTGLLPAISYIRYEQNDFAIVYTNGKTRIELAAALPKVAAAGLIGQTTSIIIGSGFGRNAQKIIDVEARKSRTIISVETIYCLVFP